ncbi:N5-glutamine S-adenosyl-L-methionine-dependent methyltransferase [Anatilimnocola aggregata]|uniref:N5-glutamine S-adenosyl-L-methionine-dependent methyltransferase n=1 Tax=Anatilimnocola aggregata TaxID=2528021 RepID=A0A517YDS1_9BACT|nr:class I SAM-dependent methyltransferase [Anatilimnocola aggregata]QDU28384.1 N5-glutamine S-adenosyl-L-methionine-dependent methyltransferase [Anatilimnocola aggregata]
MPEYRWNTSSFAEGYDAAAPQIHPYYVQVQDGIVGILGDLAAGRPTSEPLHIVDLGGGSGRLLERILKILPAATATIVDQSEAFLAIAERRLAPFGGRVEFVVSRLQEDWPAKLAQQPNALVSTSAIHHLDPGEKQALYQQVAGTLATGGLFLNGDEVRPEDDAEYQATMERWAQFMRAGMASGAIPTGFHPAAQGWIERNVVRFGEPKNSGDDCHETAATQLDYFLAAGFRRADVPWHCELWSILRGVK